MTIEYWTAEKFQIIWRFLWDLAFKWKAVTTIMVEDYELFYSIYGLQVEEIEIWMTSLITLVAVEVMK